MIGVTSTVNTTRTTSQVGTPTNMDTSLVSGLKYPQASSSYDVEPKIPKTVPAPYNPLWSKILQYIFGI